MRYFCLFVLILFSNLTLAQTYRWVDPVSGRTMITDTPPPGSVKNVNKAKDTGGEAGPESFATRQAAANFPVTLYTSAECASECKSARDLLNKRGIPFTEKSVQQKADYDELKALVGDAYVPSLKVGRESVKGFLAESYHKLLDLAGYPTSAPIGSKPSGTSPQ